MQATQEFRGVLSDFLAYHRAENRSEKTLTWHKTSLNRLARYCQINGIASVLTLTRSDIRGFIAFLQDSPGRDAGSRMSPASVATYVRSVRAFFAWLKDEEYIAENPCLKVREPRIPEQNKDVFTPSEVKRLVAVCSGTYERRDAAIVLLLYDTGLRASDVTGALLTDLSDNPPSLRVVGKGGKSRMVPIGRAANKALRRYLRYRKYDSEYVFLGRGGEPMTPNGLYQALARLGGIAGIHVNPHKFRHTFAIEYIRSGGDLFSLQKILGHHDLTMVQHYAKLADTDVLAKHRLHSPADRL